MRQATSDSVPPASGPARGPEGVATAAAMSEADELQRAHLRRFARWLLVPILFYAALDAVVAAAYRDPAVAACSVGFTLYAAWLARVVRRIPEWTVERASLAIGGGILAVALVVAAAFPPAAIGAATIPLGVVAMVLPYRSGAPLRRIVALAAAGVLLLALLGELVPTWSDLPPWLVAFYRVSSVGVGTAVVLLLLLQFHGRLSTILAHLRETNARLDERTASLAAEARERKLAVEALAVRDKAIWASISGMALADAEGRLTYVNPAFVGMWGLERPEEALGRSVGDFWRSAAEAMTVVAAIQAKGSWIGEMVARRKDGSVFDCQVVATLVREPDSGAVHLMGAFVDVTARNQAERERALLADIVTASRDEVYLFDARSLRFLFVNLGATLNLGYGLDQLRTMTPLDLDPRVTRESFEARLLGLRSGQKPLLSYESVHRRADGSLYDVEVHLQLFDRPEGGVFLAIVQDVTERRRAQERQAQLQAQLQQAQKMESVGRLAGGVAHDFNNMLTVILSNVALAQRAGASPEVAASLHEITDAAARARDLTRQLLAFGRKQILEMREVDLNEVVRGFEKMLARLIGEDISVTTVLVPEIGKVRADPVQIEQIILNLAVNARDAMAGGGRLTIRTDDVDVGPGAAGGDLQVAPGRYVRLTVADTGSGMDAETQRHVFEPFFSTKEPGKGTGLGLATVFGIVQQHGGHIRLQSEVGKGSTFQVYLPRLQQPEGRVAVRRQEEAGLGGSETILLVEDEVSVRRVLRRTLEGAGYRVLEAGDAPAAIRRAEEGPVDLLLTDVIIPGPSGRELHEALAAARPGLKVLFMSGYAEDVISSHGVLLPGIQFLQKPFSPGALLSKLREVLAAGTSRRPGPDRPLGA